ncbi:glutamate-5-semialdehyde dehydrogenase [uncultured Alistipes sp.]|uniref:glutamate-5-semialdehyde dehydrogenase n=1 Tax=uncultured Alistipes sp. TaxID=538949 RepID=UPI002617EA99|nr:glutamate-5-semialdehyde dehydrogenase [uncultured Alistipes sp.]
MHTSDLFERAVAASRKLNLVPTDRIDRTLLALADATEAQARKILEANREDLARMDPQHPMYDRLLLDEKRIAGIAADIRNVASLPSPLGIVLSEVQRPNGMTIRKTSVPFGVIGVIYEARPNVGFDVFSLCLKSGNACMLKGGSDARCSNEAIAGVIRNVLRAQGLDEDCLTLMPPDREATARLLEAVGYVDLVIPRGSKGLIDFVRRNARVPVIETGAGICHTYFDRAGDAAKATAIVLNAKTRRVSVCNALDCLVVHRDRLGDLPALCAPLAERQVTIYADGESFGVLQGNYPSELLMPADENSFGTEFLSYKMSIRTVGSLDEAVAHITRYSSRHSEAIVSEDREAIREFQRRIDAACVYANVSTAFTDGAQFGMGAEIGISTQKLHARGPMALHELTTYKYLIEGDGQVRG